MSSFFEDLQWEINVCLDVQPEVITVSTEYQFANSSEDENFYFGLLPRFHAIPFSSLIGENKNVLVEAQLIDKHENREALFIAEKRVEGIDAQSDCYMPIPWHVSEGFIPPGNMLKLRFFWTEQGPQRKTMPEGHKRWTIKHCLPLSKLFLPFEISSKNGAANIIVPYESITWEIFFPAGTNFIEEVQFNSFKPTPKNLTPNITHVTAKRPKVTFSLRPSAVKPFSDHKFDLPVLLSVPIEIEEELFEHALNEIKEYSFEVIVAVVDLRGSSKKAEEQKELPNPIEYTLRFHRLARESFPGSLFSNYSNDPLKLCMKKVVGDMLILVAPVANAPKVAEAVKKFLERLENEAMPYRAGFHVDQATSTGNFLYSLNEVGIDFLGPAVNWAAKIGDDKKNTGIRLTKPAVDIIYNIFSRDYELVQVDSLEKKPDLGIFSLRKKDSGSANLQPITIVTFSDKLNKGIIEKNSRVCVGLDPDLSYFPTSLLNKYGLNNLADSDFEKINLQNVAECIIEFNKMVIDAVCYDAVAVKPQSAHYERFGHNGILALEETLKYAREKNIIIILDAKRNDIGSTAKKYALAYLGSDFGKNAAAMPFDAITINPYLGFDGISPFIECCIQNGKGIFILVKTSNPSSGDLQDLSIVNDDCLLSHHVATLVSCWGKDVIGTTGYSSVGAVVGATYPDDVTILREKMPNNIFLMPGYGAQGGKAENISTAFDEQGLGAIISSSRAIIYPCSPNTLNFQDKIKEKVISMKNEINTFAANNT